MNNNHTILVINDNLDQLEKLAFILSEKNYRVLTAGNAREALKIAQDELPDLVISQVTMPEADGVELCRLIRADERLRFVPILLVDDLREDSEKILQGFEAGADDYVKASCEPTFIIAKAARLIERQRMSNELRESENRLQTIFDNAAIGMALVNSEWRATESNPALQRMLGYTAEELRQTSFVEITYPDDVAKTRVLIQEVIEGKRDYYQVEKRYIKKSGEVMWGNLTVSSIRNSSGEVQYVIGMLEDITERKQNEATLRFQKTLLELQSEASIDGILVVNRSGEIISHNQRFAEIWEIPEGVLAAKSDKAYLRSLLDKLVNPQEFLETISYLRQHPDETNRTEVLLRDERVLERYTAPVIDTDGTHYGRMWFFRDITKRKQAETALNEASEQLRLSQRLESVGRLAGGIAHDFNNMLTAINGYSDLSLRLISNNDPLRRNIEEIKKAGERSASLIHQLLAFSRKQVLKPKVINLNEIIIDTNNMLKPLIGEDIELKIVPSSTLGLTEADPGQLTQVIVNLAVNARDAMPHGGKLIIETANVHLNKEFAANHAPTRPGSYVLLKVSDTGTGMSDETQQHIFEPFYTTKEVGKGTGLGLATVYGIVKQSGGFIWVKSEIDKGTTFEVYLPRVDEEAELSGENNTSKKMPSGMETILLVEDESMVRNLSRQILETCGYRVIEASNGVEALSICQQPDCNIDLLMTDIVMPQMGGRELAEKLALMYPKLRLLYTSGYTDDTVVRQGVIETGANFIQKPFTSESLAQKVRELLDAKN